MKWLFEIGGLVRVNEKITVKNSLTKFKGRDLVINGRRFAQNGIVDVLSKNQLYRFTENPLDFPNREFQRNSRIKGSSEYFWAKRFVSAEEPPEFLGEDLFLV